VARAQLWRLLGRLLYLRRDFPDLVVLPLKVLSAGNGFHFPGILVGPIVNGLWGLGTALFLSWMSGQGRAE
jgi:hypothetical protein